MSTDWSFHLRVELARFRDLLSRISIPFWEFWIGMDGARMYLQVRGTGTLAGERFNESWSGRKWFLSPHMTDSEFVQTAFTAFMAALEHEAREEFKFEGAAVYGPHFNVHHLVELAQTKPLDLRADAMEGA